MYRTWVILRHTFLDCIVQPIFGILLMLGVAILGLFFWLPFFTLGEDAVMYKSVGLDIVTLIVLIMTLFATSRSIFEEIEDRSMLTLMSKPVSKWEVLLGKYLGIICSALLAVALLGLVLSLATWARIPRDYAIRTVTLDEAEITKLHDLRFMHLGGLIPSLVLSWLQISVLAAIGVALSTRFSLVVNLPAVIIIYIAGNLTRFLMPIWDNVPGSALEGKSFLTKALAQVLVVVLPYLEHFDLRQATITGKIAVPGTQLVNDPHAYSYAAIWAAVGLAVLYAICYSTFALLGGMLMFRTRELGGAEG
jgi:ABC-type transport system involved in multi-copper enzyme maturation permease subunit